MTRPPAAAADGNASLDERIADAVTAAQEAFWAAIAGRFPEVRSGDFPPDADAHFDQVTRAAVRLWLDLNKPPEGLAATAQAAGEEAAARREAAVERLRPLAAVCIDVEGLVHEVLQDDARDRAAEYDESDFADWLVWKAIYERAERIAEETHQAGPAGVARLLVGLLGEHEAERQLTAPIDTDNEIECALNTLAEMTNGVEPDDLSERQVEIRDRVTAKWREQLGMDDD